MQPQVETDLRKRDEVVEKDRQRPADGRTVIPYAGISRRSATTMIVSAATELANVQNVFPAMASTTSTNPQPVATSITRLRITSTDVPTAYVGPNTSGSWAEKTTKQT